MKYDNYESNREYFIEYQKTSIKAKEARKRYYEKNKDKWKIANINYRSTKEGRINTRYNDIKCRAKRKGIEFSLIREDFKWPEQCPILGIPIDFFAEGNSDNSPSVDRVDNTKGYIKGNVIFISNRANRIKNDSTIEELEKLIVYLKKVLV